MLQQLPDELQGVVGAGPELGEGGEPEQGCEGEGGGGGDRGQHRVLYILHQAASHAASRGTHPQQPRQHLDTGDSE